MARQYHDGKVAGRGQARRRENAMNLQRHHIIVALIAIVVAFALASNYYLW
jgi:hypothetical protein